MGWAKYSEDNWDAIFERLEARDNVYNLSSRPETILEQKKETNKKQESTELVNRYQARCFS